jgi:two-component system sensor histidine kinase ArlS
MSRNSAIHHHQQSSFFTLRIRLALWTSGLFVVLCLFLVTFINLVTALTKSHQLLTISFIGFLLVTIGGGSGAYWIAGNALRPVRKMSEAATRISATNLSTRLHFDGPHEELKELSDAFDAMLNRLERAFDQQNRFVADVAHELRTPLATLQTNLDVAEKNLNATGSDYLTLLATVRRSVTRLEQLVVALLTLATAEQMLVHEEVILEPLLEEVLTNLQSEADSRHITLHLTSHTEASVRGDPHLLSQVFRNLIENAIRYNRPEGCVMITLDETARGVAIRVKDSGSGITGAEQEHVFERFYRVDHSRSRHRGGAGLGLSIVQHLLSLHNGQVTLEHSSPDGSTFLVELPILGSASWQKHVET